MNDKEYKLLVKNHFDNSQINQIDKLTKLFSVETLVEYIHSCIDTDILRDTANAIKKRHYILDDEEISDMFRLLYHNINPSLYLDQNLSLTKRNYIMEILNLKIEEDTIPGITPKDINYQACVEAIAQPFVDNKMAETCFFNIKAGQDISKYIRKDFTIEQIILAKSLYEKGFEKYIDEIPKLKVDFIPIGSVKKIDELGLDFTRLLNTYPPEDLRVVLLNIANGIDLEPYLKDRPDPKKAALCEVLVKMKFDDETISKMLDEIPYVIPYENKFLYENIIEAKMKGFPVEKIFENFPKSKLLNLAMNYYNEGYEIKTLKDGFNYINDHSEDTYRVTAYDYKLIFDLYMDGVNIDIPLKYQMNSYDIENLIKIADEAGIDKEKMFERKFDFYEISLMKLCLEHNKKDLIKSLVKIKHPDEEAYDYISKMIEQKQFPGFDYSKLLFDKGADIFSEYNSFFEFSEEQKTILASMLYEGTISIFDLEQLRDSSIDEKTLFNIEEKLVSGISLAEILENNSNSLEK